MKKKPPAARHILVAAVGNTPQIVTETLFGLMIRQGVPITDVYLVTTAKGKKIALETLAGPTGQIAQFCKDYSIASGSVTFTEEQIITIKEDNGQELEDIRTSAQNQLFASQLFGVMEQLTRQETDTIYCSIAGGRKTMSAYLMLALTIYGRPGDKLLHVLVPEQFETNSEFFFPPKKPIPIAVRNANKLVVETTANAIIELAEIPIVLLRDKLSQRSFQQLKQGVVEMIQVVQSELRLTASREEKLVIHLAAQSVTIGGKPIVNPNPKETFKPGWRLLLAYYADRKVNYCREPGLDFCGNCQACFVSDQEVDLNRYLELHQRFNAKKAERLSGAVKDAGEKLRNSLVGNIQSYRTKTNECLQTTSPSLEISATEEYAGRRYGLSLDKTLIEILD